MGRADDTWRKTFAMASMFADRSILDGSISANDVVTSNDRVLRHLAKITINPALTHGLAHEVGSIGLGLMADIVLWKYADFATKPNLIIKNGLPAWGVSGDPGSSINEAQPLVIGPQFGAYGATAADLGVHFSNASATTLLTRRKSVPVKNTRSIRSSQMIRHGVLGEVEVSANGELVTLDGQIVTSSPLTQAALTRRYLI
jgi:urease subunit alpha